jgi:hypothetical protein
LTLYQIVGITIKRENQMKTHIAKDYRVRTVKTVITEYSVIAADTEDPLERWEQDRVLLSIESLEETPISSELRNGGD